MEIRGGGGGGKGGRHAITRVTWQNVFSISAHL